MMMLEDFFSNTKMKDGFTSPSRVEELVSLMQKEKDSVVKNIDDATRHWVAVASTIAATKDRECLDLFIKLDGLGFINRWLNDAKKFCIETNESSVEESITAMLEALEKLHVDNEQSVSSGIWITVKSLLDHSRSQVQDKARALFDSWKQARVSDAVDHDVEGSGPCRNDGITVSSMHAEEGSQSKCSESDVPLPKASLKEEDTGGEHTRAEILLSNSGLQVEEVEDVQTKTHNNELCSHVNVDHSNMEDKPPDHVVSIVSNSALENSFVKEKSTISMEVTSSIETCSSPVPKQSRDEGQSDALKMNEFSKDEQQVHKVSSFPEKSTVTASASTSSMVEPRTVSSAADDSVAHEIITESAPEKNLDTNGDELHRKVTALGDEKTQVSEKDNGRDDMAITKNCSTYLLKKTGEDDESHSEAMPDLSGDECTYGKRKDSENSFPRIRVIGLINEDRGHTSSHPRNNSDFSKPGVENRSADVNNRRTSDIELEYGIVDALEVARKVAREVEREVVDYRERSCSSSDKISDGGIRQPGSPDSISGKQDLVNEDSSKEVPTGQNYSGRTYQEGEGHVVNSDNLETEPENGIADMESSQVTEAAQEPEVNTEKGLCDFDLNQEVCSDDMDHLVNPISTPISVVSASRPAAAPGLPAAPLQFEGNLGWKGCAATSAFRPASPRRVSDYDKTTLTVGEIGNSSKQRLDCLDIDLNVAEECGDDKHVDLMPEKQIPVSSGLQSAESSLEVSPRRSERLKLDLNRVSDDSDAPAADFRLEGRLLYNRNGHRSPSPASSSSSMQPSLRNIDLNDRPFLHTDISDPVTGHGKSPLNVNAFGVSKPGDPVISIMGARVEVSRKDFIPQVSSLPNGKTLDTSMDGNVPRTGSVLGLGPYSHSPIFGYNGFTNAPTLSYSSPMYGGASSIPYMVDARGAPVLPQIMGSAAAVPQTYTQPPFFMSMTSAPSGLNGGGSSRQSFDLNSGFPIEGVNRDSTSVRHFFMTGQGKSMEEDLRASSQPSSSSGVGGKRKEPDSGWETYPFNYRQHQQPPWK